MRWFSMHTCVLPVTHLDQQQAAYIAKDGHATTVEGLQCYWDPVASGLETFPLLSTTNFFCRPGKVLEEPKDL